MSGDKHYYVYIMASKSGAIYTGVTNNLERRVYEHKDDVIPGFSKKYKTHKLVYYEETGDVLAAIEREKQIKGWVRKKKADRIATMNPWWRDLSTNWYETGESSPSAEGSE